MNDIEIRPAGRDDIAAIVGLLVDDTLGSGRDSQEDLTPYLAAFERVTADPNQELVVMTRPDPATGARTVIGTLQLTIIPGLSQRGTTRALVEAVRIAGSERGGGLGTILMRWTIDRARERGATLVQLTSNGTRENAHRFYRNLGFTDSHVGFKLTLRP
ncbi:GNAT family N-acetyltransferase [Embleya sp. NBC_00888]|uniref:GNAT family N-acetyltransferase n=1 Tax=Embleya sp. NBC_00888 TaxID=2975960 RepID=UPI00386C3FF1|nr:GNAT family N-acetyltransferase [Embleya sp. NBC_00888]